MDILDVSEYGVNILHFLKAQKLTHKFITKKKFSDEEFARCNDEQHYNAHKNKYFYEFKIKINGKGFREKFEHFLTLFFDNIYVRKYTNDTDFGEYVLLSDNHFVLIMFSAKILRMRLFKYSQLDKNHRWMIYELGSATYNTAIWENLHYLHYLENLPQKNIQAKNENLPFLGNLKDDIIEKIVNGIIFRLSENDVNDELNKKIAVYYLQSNSSTSPRSTRSSSLSSPKSTRSSSSSHKSTRSSSKSPKLKKTSKSLKYSSK